ncbi:hypothetical protein RFI_29364 [Reticulomyxa filosa]|uniref:Uncharacterized protein n=1 Tax=Reticulomyxa filosa TaxID=46433 RepID=X6M3H8_RETFI|nr:hypothetical protein RFI_29364 [Reticulomyxa filosa]|eukprot:ETO08022.1 hypothetical protein RFI_29364 [Reticulomyxa filosa]
MNAHKTWIYMLCINKADAEAESLASSKGGYSILAEKKMLAGYQEQPKSENAQEEKKHTEDSATKNTANATSGSKHAARRERNRQERYTRYFESLPPMTLASAIKIVREKAPRNNLHVSTYNSFVSFFTSRPLQSSFEFLSAHNNIITCTYNVYVYTYIDEYFDDLINCEERISDENDRQLGELHRLLNQWMHASWMETAYSLQGYVPSENEKGFDHSQMLLLTTFTVPNVKFRIEWWDQLRGHYKIAKLLRQFIYTLIQALDDVTQVQFTFYNISLSICTRISL